MMLHIASADKSAVLRLSMSCGRRCGYSFRFRCSYNRLQLVILWWGIGQHIGRVLPINKYGHLVNHLHQVISGDGVYAHAPRCRLLPIFVDIRMSCCAQGHIAVYLVCNAPQAAINHDLL